jgi:hypothetical protein
MVEGKLQIEAKPGDTEVIHVVVQRCFNLNKLMQQTAVAGAMPVIALSRADEKNDNPDPRGKEQLQNDVFYKGRNFR